MAKRRGLSKRTRFEVFKRDCFTCQYCGRRPPQVLLEVDHVIPVSKGGGNGEENLVTACADCNSGKSDVDLQGVPESIKAKLGTKQELAAQLREYTKYVEEIRSQEADIVERLGVHWCNQIYPEKDKRTLGPARQRSLRIFLERLPLDEIYKAIDIAFSRKHDCPEEDTWKYFCGVCWYKVKEDARVRGKEALA